MKHLSFYWRVLISIVCSTILLAIIWLTSQFREPPDINVMTIFWFLIVYLVFESIFHFQKRALRSKWLEKSAGKQILFVLTSIAIGTALYMVLFYFFKWADYLIYNSEKPNHRHLSLSFLTGFSLSIIFSLIQYLANLKQHHFNTILENERMKGEIAEVNLTILKNQLDPHFLFNNLNTLYYLIDQDVTQAKSFLKNIAGIYRQILQNKHNTTIAALEEYTIARQYLEVVKSRYEAALVIEDESNMELLKNKILPPLVLQQLIENAVKHNIIDLENPLTICMKTTETSFVLTTKGSRKPKVESFGSGLANIKKRFSYFTDREVVINSKPHLFEVIIPLLSHEN